MLLALGGLLLFGIIHAENERKRDFQAFKEEFSVGKASKNFIKRARELGADEYHVYMLGRYDSVNVRAPDYPPSSDSFVSKWDDTTMPEGTNKEKLENYEKHLDLLEANFESRSEGQAKIQLTVIPPFLRAFCEISFKDGKVTENKVWQLD